MRVQVPLSAPDISFDFMRELFNGRTSAFQAECCGFESHLSLQYIADASDKAYALNESRGLRQSETIEIGVVVGGVWMTSLHTKGRLFELVMEPALNTGGA